MVHFSSKISLKTFIKCINGKNSFERRKGKKNNFSIREV